MHFKLLVAGACGLGALAIVSQFYFQHPESPVAGTSALPVDGRALPSPLTPAVVPDEPRVPADTDAGKQQAGELPVIDRLRAGDPEMMQMYGFGERELRLSAIDLDALRAQMPDNLFWEMSAPTRDESLNEKRRETRAYWREQRNLISANLADEYAIRDYYATQAELSEDYVAITDELLNRYSAELPEADYHLIQMANRLHSARLQEIPLELAAGLRGREEFLARRESWRRDPAAYEETLRIGREAALEELAERSGGGGGGAR